MPSALRGCSASCFGFFTDFMRPRMPCSATTSTCYGVGMAVEATEVRLAPISRAPTMDDARKAAEAAGADPRVEQVLVFGSVARGDASEHSDIDLLVLIGDASNDEWGKASHEILSEVNTACGDVWDRPIDLIVQRRADFEYLSTYVTASFEHVAWGEAVTLYQSFPNLKPAHGAIDGVPRDNLALAATHIKSARRHVNAIRGSIRGIPTTEAETAASSPNSAQSIEDEREDRYSKFLEEAHMVIEQSFRSVASSSDGRSLGKGHDIDDFLSKMDDIPEKSALEKAVEPLRKGEVLKSWRLVAYTGHLTEWVAEITAENASAHIEAALACSRIAIEAIERRAGGNQDLLDTIAGTREALAYLKDSPRSPAELESGPVTTTKESRRGLARLFGGRRDHPPSPQPDPSEHVVGLPFSHDELVEAGAMLSGSTGQCGHPTPGGENDTCQNPHPGTGGTCSAGHQR